MKSLRLGTFVFCALFAGVLFAQDQMKPGRWEVTMQMDMPGMPVKMPPMTQASCITPEQAKNPGSTVQGGRGRGNPSDCKTTDQKVEGNKVTWKMVCTGAQAMTGDGEMVFNGDSYAGKMNMTTPQGAMAMQITGKRLGDCQ